MRNPCNYTASTILFRLETVVRNFVAQIFGAVERLLREKNSGMVLPPLLQKLCTILWLRPELTSRLAPVPASLRLATEATAAASAASVRLEEREGERRDKRARSFSSSSQSQSQGGGVRASQRFVDDFGDEVEQGSSSSDLMPPPPAPQEEQAMDVEDVFEEGTAATSSSGVGGWGNSSESDAADEASLASYLELLAVAVFLPNPEDGRLNG